MKKFTEEQIKSMWLTLRKKYGFSLVAKRKSLLMKAAAKILDIRHAKDPSFISGSDFLDLAWTTVKNKIYYPTSTIIGEGNQSELMDQIEKACHEVTHVTQEIGITYLLDSDRLVKIETDAYLATMEIVHWMTGEILAPRGLARQLSEYGCDADQIKYAEEKYGVVAKMIERGLYRSSVVKTVIGILS